MVADQVGQALLQIKGLAHAAHVPALVLDADKQRSARSVDEGDDRLERAHRGGEVALEREGLALRALEQFDEVHALGILLGSTGKHQPSDLATTTCCALQLDEVVMRASPSRGCCEVLRRRRDISGRNAWGRRKVVRRYLHIAVQLR